MPKSELNGCTLQVRPVLSNTKVFQPNTTILARKSNSGRRSAIPSIPSIAVIIVLIICLLGYEQAATFLSPEGVEGVGSHFLFCKILVRCTEVSGQAVLKALTSGWA